MGRTLTWTELLSRSGTNYCSSVVGNETHSVFFQLLCSGVASTSCQLLRLWGFHALAICFQIPCWGGTFGQGPGCGFHRKICAPQRKYISVQVPSSKFRIGGQSFDFQLQSQVRGFNPPTSLIADIQVPELQGTTITD